MKILNQRKTVWKRREKCQSERKEALIYNSNEYVTLAAANVPSVVVMVAPNACRAIQKCGPNRIPNFVTINQIFLVFCSISHFHMPKLSVSLSRFCETGFNFYELISNWRINVSIYISSHNDKFSFSFPLTFSVSRIHTHKKGKKVSIIYRLADCTCLSFAYKTTFFVVPMRTKNSGKLYGTELNRTVAVGRLWIFLDCSFCLVKQKLLLQHMDW